MVSKRWTWSTAVAVIFAGLTNAHAHVHYCFDGQEPPAIVHLADAADHDHELPGHDADGGDHDDLDVDVPNRALTKSAKYDSPAIAAAFYWSVPPMAPQKAALARHDASPPTPDPHYRRPPTRGPPL